MNDSERETSGPTQTTRDVVITDLDKAISIYSNVIQVTVSVFDFRLTFGERLSSTQERFEIKAVARVYMSPQHAKSVAMVLTRQVEKYEQQFGSIHLPNEIMVEDPTSASETERPS